MSAYHLTILIVFCAFTFTVWGKPQQQNAEPLTAGEQNGARSSSSRMAAPTNGGQPFYGITVTRVNGGLRPVYASDASAIPSRPTINHRPDETITSAPATVTAADCTIVNRCKRDSVFVFPADDTNQTNAKKCETTFCEDVDDYPVAMVEHQLRKDRAKFNVFFGEDKSFDEVQLTQRINGDGPGEDDLRLCRSIKKIIYPRKGVTIDKDWKFIVNQNDSTQGVVVEICDSELETPCQFSTFFPNGYKAVCKQHYVYRQLVSFSEQGGPFEKDYFKMPSCCQCVYRRV